MRSSVCAAALALATELLPSVGIAQAPATSSTSTAPAAPSAGESPAPAGATSAAPTPPVVPATGYGWSTPKRRGESAHVPRRRGASDAIMPGFETLADGSTRLFVELSKPVSYDTKTARGSVTYVLKDVQVDRRNNYNPLVTVHFNTPVTSARLVPRGRDLLFVVELRANVQPTVTVDAGKDGASMMRIEFPKGDYLPAPPPPAASSQPAGPTNP